MTLMPFLSTLLANLLHKPVTRPYPVQPRAPFDRSRGSIGITIEDCIYCGQCMRKCPTSAIETNRAEAYWQINRLRCIQCGACVECCPKKCLQMLTGQPLPSQGGQTERFMVGVPEETHA